ncbi:hypothetical protein HPB48_025496 [Haemaphysalis longicornis]|uniref:Uncharacterized protein n=1 Tax=Haemaphysalis longicornis TaxID=44386 RepID=A0A9J6H9I7_HAELO|nr:hypothetical protein HPB48_025496 [Haemaphysalis longicornis]
MQDCRRRRYFCCCCTTPVRIHKLTHNLWPGIGLRLDFSCDPLMRLSGLPFDDLRHVPGVPAPGAGLIGLLRNRPQGLRQTRPGQREGSVQPSEFPVEQTAVSFPLLARELRFRKALPADSRARKERKEAGRTHLQEERAITGA